MTTLDQALEQLRDGSALSFEARAIILHGIARLEDRNADMESSLKAAAVLTGQLTEDITRLINGQPVLATIGTNSLLACGREE